MIVYGLKTCDTCRAALRDLRAARHEPSLRDVRVMPLDERELDRLLAAFGSRLVNRSSATWRGLSEAERAEPPKALVARHPALMKRPAISDGDRLTLGWDAATRSIWCL